MIITEIFYEVLRGKINWNPQNNFLVSFLSFFSFLHLISVKNLRVKQKRKTNLLFLMTKYSDALIIHIWEILKKREIISRELTVLINETLLCINNRHFANHKNFNKIIFIWSMSLILIIYDETWQKLMRRQKNYYFLKHLEKGIHAEIFIILINLKKEYVKKMKSTTFF